MKVIDLFTWHRAKHYQLFANYRQPFFTVSMEFDITHWLEQIKRDQQPFFLSFLYQVMSSLNRFEAFRYRKHNQQVVLHDVIHASTTYPTTDGLFAFCTIPFSQDQEKFIQEGKKILECHQDITQLDDDPFRTDLAFISSLPWVPFTSVEHAMSGDSNDSFVRVTWGKYHLKDNKMMIPLSITCHHGFVDGKDIGLFYDELNRQLSNNISF